MIKATTQFTTTNNSNRFMVVADHHRILSHHATVNEALRAMDAIAPTEECDPLAATPHAVIEVLWPGQTTTGILEHVAGLADDAKSAEDRLQSTADLFGVNVEDLKKACGHE